jgi:hypothetical protein
MGTRFLHFQQLRNKLPILNLAVTALNLAEDQRQQINISEQCVERFNKNKTDFVRQFITMYEAWIHHYTPESKKRQNSG